MLVGGQLLAIIPSYVLLPISGRGSRALGFEDLVPRVTAPAARLHWSRTRPNRRASSSRSRTEEGCHFLPPRAGRSPIWSN